MQKSENVDEVYQHHSCILLSDLKRQVLVILWIYYFHCYFMDKLL